MKFFFQNYPDYNLLRVFGCAGWPNLWPYNAHKLQPHSIKCVFLGYSLHHRGYKCLHVSISYLYISRDVLFEKSAFPLATTTVQHSSISFSTPRTQNQAVQSLPLSLGPCIMDLSFTRPTPLVTSFDSQLSLQPTPIDPSTSILLSSSLIQTSHTSQLNAPTQPTHPMATWSKNNITKPKTFTNGTIHYPIPHALLIDGVCSSEPTCYSSAVKDPKWREAMNLEFDALLKNRTWTLVPSWVARSVIGCKWVFWINRRAEGSIERYKACLITKGFHQ